VNRRRNNTPAESPAALRRASSVPAAAPASANGQILVVDDDPLVLALLAGALEGEGYSVQTARDGVEGLSAWRASGGTIGVVLTDINMPRMDGPALVAEFARFEADVRVIYMTGSGGLDGLDPHIPILGKPISLATLHALVQAAFDLKP